MFTWLPWWFASLISNAAIILTEYINSTTEGSWLDALPRTFLLIVIAQFCLFHSFNNASHWMLAWAVFTVGNSAMRLGFVYFVAGHGISNWFSIMTGACVIISGAMLIKLGLK